MNSPRPTSLIRQYLQLEQLNALLSTETRELKTLMRQTDVTIMDRKLLTDGLWIQYRWRNRLYEVVYALPMLDAEISGIVPHGKVGDSV